MLKNILKFVSLTLAAAMSFSCFETGVSAVDEPVPEYEADFSREDDYMNTITDYAMAAFSAEAEEPELVYSDIPIEKFQVSNLSPQTVTDIDYTDWWYSEWDDCRYIFLPATADRNDLIITYQSENGELTLNGNKVVSGASTSLLSEADEFDIKVSNTDCGKLKIMQSNLGCIYLSTSTGGLDALDNNRWLIETGSALMLDADGAVEYSGELKKIKAHGNSSWDYSKKKSYNINLPKKENLYGMGKAKKWALLSNYLDHSMLRNKVSIEISRAGGMEYAMDSVFVDLYADGSYRGTYQLNERVQVQKQRVNIRDLEEETEEINDKELDEYTPVVVGIPENTSEQYVVNSYKYYDIPNNPKDITGGYLLQFQICTRYGYKAKSGFVTSRGQAVEIDGPEYASKEQVLYIRNFVQEMEDAIYSETGYNSKGKHYSEYIDVDSLITAYLVQEISMNIDATQTSFYFYKDSDLTGDGKIHFGPAWDFDLAYGTFSTIRQNSDGDICHSFDTKSLFVTCFPINGYEWKAEEQPSIAGISWIGTLYKKDGFAKRAAEIYFERFEPYITELTSISNEGGALITQMAEEIKPSAEMNNARWHTYGGSKYCVFGSSSGKDYMESVDIMRRYLFDRKNGLNAIWEEYKKVEGDVNSDGEFSVADIVMLQRFLLGEAELADWQAGDICKDGVIDSFDLAAMRKLIVTK
ncbi:MAG: CotH kinase family protein [Ruminococcus sp.]|nr:CotH kinase family protein [Ruminococcus sp.]